jgi:hypothetical protein
LKRLASFRILWLVSVLAVATLVTGSLCGADMPSRLEFNITGQPVGGVNVQMVTCTFEGWLEPKGGGQEGGVDPVTLTATWTTAAGAHGAQTYTYVYERRKLTYTFIKAAPSGLFLDKDFWVVFTWKDCNGPHTVTSSVAHCTVQ